MTVDADVVVVGGGIAGLAAARAVRFEGLDPVVLEARNRVGGKTKSTETEYGDYVEYGGQWVGADQDRVRALLDEFDLETRPQYYDGKIVRRTNGERYVGETYDETLRALSGEAEAELFAAFEEIDRCTAQVPSEQPQEAPKAAEWDRTTLASWMDDWFNTADAQTAFEVMIPGIYTAEPADLSFLFFLYYAKTAGGFSMLNGRSSEGDSHGEIVVNVQGLSSALAADLDGRVAYGQPVYRIEENDAGVTVSTPNRSYEGKYTVVALPPALAGRIEYDPGLPAARDELTQRMPNANVLKVHLRYTEPFWRDAGFSGLLEDDVGPANYYFDDGTPGGDTGRLVGFVCGEDARIWADRSTADLRSTVTDQLAALFDDDRFHEPVAFIDRSWSSEPLSWGGYHGYPTPGTMVACWDALREPVGRVHWAGAETATKWYGHMDGAIRSGDRVAEEIASRSE
ncbi:flavin monoamine oxidase family protein [Haladaptatus sp. NG-WS-4]